jgi:Rad3-related DNA helicase
VTIDIIPTVPPLEQIPHAPKGWGWRGGQQELVQRVINSPKKIVLLQAETGTGKTLLAWSLMMASKKKGQILVNTRQLERQYLRDFDNLIMMEGRSHFTCNVTGEPADGAPCTIGVQCQLKKFGCNYFSHKYAAMRNQIVVHNYAYFLLETRSQHSAFDKTEWLICDEAHTIQQVLMDAEIITISKARARRLGLTQPPSTLMDIHAWAAAAIQNTLLPRATELEAEANDLGILMGDDEEMDAYDRLSGIDDQSKLTENQSRVIRGIKEVRGMIQQFYELILIKPEAEGIEWVVDAVSDPRRVQIKPLFGAKGFQRISEMASEKIVLMSAYLAPQLLVQNLGLDPNEVEIIEADKIFDRTNSPIYFMPVVKMNHSTSDAEWQRVTRVIDALIDKFAPKSGMVHVPSVKLRNTILKYSRHKGKMIVYDGISHFARQEGALTKDEAIDAFANGEGQRVLLGQSISTGVDIPYVPEFNIIVKLAFPSIADPALKARMAVDKGYYPFLTMCEIVQAVGRGKRADDHDATTVILDLQFKWFHASNRQHFPAWFNDSLVRDGWGKFPDAQRFRQELMKVGVVIPR